MEPGRGSVAVSQESGHENGRYIGLPSLQKNTKHIKLFVFVGEFVHSLNTMGYMIYVDTINIRWYNGIELGWDRMGWVKSCYTIF